MNTSPALPLASERAQGMMLPAPIPHTFATTDVCRWSVCRVSRVAVFVLTLALGLSKVFQTSP